MMARKPVGWRKESKEHRDAALLGLRRKRGARKAARTRHNPLPTTTNRRKGGRDFDFGGKYFGFELSGGHYKLSLGNLSDAGWYWSGDKTQLAGFLWRIAHSKTKEEFLSGAKETGLTYKKIKADVLTALKKHDDAMYEATGDNVRWRFGEDYVDWESELDEASTRTGIPKEKIDDANPYSRFKGTNFDAFEKSDTHSDIQKRLIKIFSVVDSFTDLFEELSPQYPLFTDDMMTWDNHKASEAITSAIKDAGLDKPSHKTGGGRIKGWRRSKHHARPTTKMAWESIGGEHIAIDYVPSSSIPYRIIINGIYKIDSGGNMVGYDSTGTLTRAKNIAINYMRKHPNG